MSMILYLAGKNQRRDYGFLSSLIYELFYVIMMKTRLLKFFTKGHLADISP